MAQMQTAEGMKEFEVVPHDQWQKARTEFLAKEKEFTRARDELSAARRRLPWEKVEKNYAFEGASGKQTLSDLFGGKKQLIVYHFMYGPDDQAGCKSCSFWADNFNGIDVHLAHRDTAFVAISRAPYEKLKAYKQRMGWNFNWYSSASNDFNFDHHVSFSPEQIAGEREALLNYRTKRPGSPETVGISVFVKDIKDDIYHTYSCYRRGVDMLNVAYHYLDLTPKGRDETDQKPHAQAWVRRRDEYQV